MRYVLFSLGLAIFGPLEASEVHAAQQTSYLLNGTYHAATLCKASIQSAGDKIFVTPWQCHRAINGFRFELTLLADGTYAGQGMRLEVWDQNTVLMKANGEYLLERFQGAWRAYICDAGRAVGRRG